MIKLLLKLLNKKQEKIVKPKKDTDSYIYEVLEDKNDKKSN